MSRSSKKPGFDKWLKFASSYAESVDPLAGLRADIARVVADAAAKRASGTPTSSPTTAAGDAQEDGAQEK